MECFILACFRAVTCHINTCSIDRVKLCIGTAQIDIIARSTFDQAGNN